MSVAVLLILSFSFACSLLICLHFFLSFSLSLSPLSLLPSHLQQQFRETEDCTGKKEGRREEREKNQSLTHDQM